MTPRQTTRVNSTADASADNDQGDATTTTTTTNVITQVFYPDNGAPYIRCESTKAFVNPTLKPGMPSTPEDINRRLLNLDLGQSLITRYDNPQKLLWTIRFLDSLLVEWWEPFLFFLLRAIPLSIKRAVTFGGWKLYFQLHKLLLGRRTGIHPSQSFEYHALTTVMWWSRFVAITPRRMRFSLSQLHVCSPNVVPSKSIQHIEENMLSSSSSSSSLLTNNNVPKRQTDHCTVRGLYLNKPNASTTIFWIYGGAYLAGDTHGNVAVADWVAEYCGGVNVFLPEFRLAPAANLEDVLWDVVLAYKWLLSNCVDPKKIIVLGISSGGAVAVKLMQLIRDHNNNNNNNTKGKGGEPLLPESIRGLFFEKEEKEKNTTSSSFQMPMAAALFAPYVDYTEPKKGSFLHYARHDLIVNESVQEYGLPYLGPFLGQNDNNNNDNDNRRVYSPVYGSMEGLPPMVVTVSEHECVYDMTIELVNKCREAGVPVTLGVWKYMCHVFSFFWAFCPEGRESMTFMCDWIKERGV
jgi:acetyl esterase/lipase